MSKRQRVCIGSDDRVDAIETKRSSTASVSWLAKYHIYHSAAEHGTHKAVEVVRGEVEMQEDGD